MRFFVVFFCGYIISSCSPDVQAAEIKVAAAANVKYVLDELAKAYAAESGDTVVPIVASSGKLTSQIENGAPYDVFMSADTEFPARLAKEGLTRGSPKIYARGTLVLWSLTGADVTKGLAVLSDASVVKIAVPNPKAAPYGRAAVDALKSVGLYADVNHKFVYGESIAQANQYIVAKTVDAGFTAKGIVMAPDMKGKGAWADVPMDLYKPIEQAVVILKSAVPSADGFYAFLFTSKAQEIFKAYGYLIPEGASS
jgi:molybdate transport system substrate-binding protein